MSATTKEKASILHELRRSVLVAVHPVSFRVKESAHKRRPRVARYGEPRRVVLD